MEQIIYHGTTLTNAQKIVKNKDFQFKKRPNHWLGNGIYFFVNDFEAAKWWAGVGNNAGKRGAVLEYDLKVSEDVFLNLDTLTARKRFNKFYKEYIENKYKIVLNVAEEKYIREHPSEKEKVIRSKILQKI